MTITVGALKPADVRPMARLHRAAFPGFFLSALGEPFLVQFYRGFLTDDRAVTVVARDACGTVLGAAVGTTDPTGYFGRLVKNRWPGFFLASARAVVLNPRTAPRLLRAIRYRADTPDGSQGALLSSLCVDPSQRRNGLGRQLVDAWTLEVAGRGLTTAYLTTDAHENASANCFYQAQGWALSASYSTREGRSLNRYTKSWEVHSF